MKKILKKLGFIFIFLICFTATGCSTSFCTDEDTAAIVEGLVEVFDAGTGEGNYATPTTEMLEKASITSSTIQTKYSITLTEVTWETISSCEKATEIKTEYAEYIYKNYHPKACLTTEEGTKDSVTGAEISKKTFGDAAKNGLLEIIAYPISWLIVTFANLISSGTHPGWSFVVSIFIVTFIVRGVVLACTFKSSKQTQKMQQLQPELDKIQRKYAGRTDAEAKNAQSMEMMNLYKKYDINPMSSLIGPFLTLPIFIGVYSAVKDTTIIFDGSLFGISFGTQLSSAITSGSIFAIIVFILMGVSQFLTMKMPQWLNKKKVPEYKKQQQPKGGSQQMMTWIMLAMVIFVGWMLPVAMSIYWVASSLFSLGQTFLMDYINKHQKPAEKVGVFR